MKKLNFEITIKAPVEKVWNTMLDDATYREWTKVFNEKGSWYEGSWEKGSPIRFLGPADNETDIQGMVSEIADNRKYEFISIKHLGMVMNGVEDTTSPEVKSWSSSFENYTFTKIDENTTKVEVELDVPDEYAGMFDVMWPKALNKLKEISER